MMMFLKFLHTNSGSANCYTCDPYVPWSFSGLLARAGGIPTWEPTGSCLYVTRMLFPDPTARTHTGLCPPTL